MPVKCGKKYDRGDKTIWGNTQKPISMDFYLSHDSCHVNNINCLFWLNEERRLAVLDFGRVIGVEIMSYNSNKIYCITIVIIIVIFIILVILEKYFIPLE